MKGGRIPHLHGLAKINWQVWERLKWQSSAEGPFLTSKTTVVMLRSALACVNPLSTLWLMSGTLILNT